MIDKTRIMCHFKIVRQFVARENKIKIYNCVENGNRWWGGMEIRAHIAGEDLFEVSKIEEQRPTIIEGDPCWNEERSDGHGWPVLYFTSVDVSIEMKSVDGDVENMSGQTE